MGLNGIIIINHFGIPRQSITQAERLKSEFAMRGVKTKIVTSGELAAGITDSRFTCAVGECDFAVYLDKDKYLSAGLEKAGIKLFNSHTAIRLCDDKCETYLALEGKGLKIADTIFAPLCYLANEQPPHEYLAAVVNRLGFPLVVKESYGSRGKGVYLAQDLGQLLGIYEQVKTRPHLYQKYISERRGVDMRVIVIGKSARAAMLRINQTDFRSNVALGGRGVAVDITASENTPFITAAERAADVLALDYCGVDLLFDRDGKPVICEVNSNAFFEGIESVTGVNVGAQYAEYIINTIKNK